MPSELAPILAIAGLILVKEAGAPIPVPGDLVVIGAGVAAGRREFDPILAVVAIVVASVIGGILQYGLLRSVARPALMRLVGRLGSAERVDSLSNRMRNGGPRSVALARSTPGVRIVAVAASAIAGIPVPAFIAGLAVGNALFIGAHFALGYLVGEPILTTAGSLLGPLTFGLVAVAVVGGVGWYLIGGRRRGRDPLTTALSWADACCPACLALGSLPVAD
jgi:membrane protein DedA with SNARE-associated domain